MKTRWLLELLLLAFVFNTASAAESQSVKVETVALKQHLMSDKVSGYGVVSPNARTLRNISLPRSGQVITLSVNVGQKVKKGTILLEFRTGPDAGRAYREALQAVTYAEGEVKRNEQLVRQQLATQSQLAGAKKSLADAKAALQAQEQMGAGHITEQITAPIDGVVMAIQAAQGDRLAANAPVLQLSSASEQRVEVGIEPEEVAQLLPGMSVTITPVFDATHTFSGRVAQVSGMINPKTQFVNVQVDVVGSGLLPGTQVYAQIQLSRHKAWVVPRSAVLKDKQGAYIFQVRQGKAHRVNVTTGIESDGLVAVKGPFDANDPVVRLGNYELSDGMMVVEGTP